MIYIVPHNGSFTSIIELNCDVCTQCLGVVIVLDCQDRGAHISSRVGIGICHSEVDMFLPTFGDDANNDGGRHASFDPTLTSLSMEDAPAASS
jgi:hypothetical protein